MCIRFQSCGNPILEEPFSFWFSDKDIKSSSTNDYQKATIEFCECCDYILMFFDPLRAHSNTEHRHFVGGQEMIFVSQALSSAENLFPLVLQLDHIFILINSLNFAHQRISARLQNEI